MWKELPFRAINEYIVIIITVKLVQTHSTPDFNERNLEIMNTKSQLPMPSFVGNTANQSSPPLCFPPSKIDKGNDNQQPSTLCCCRKAPKSQCIAAIGEKTWGYIWVQGVDICQVFFNILNDFPSEMNINLAPPCFTWN